MMQSLVAYMKNGNEIESSSKMIIRFSGIVKKNCISYFKKFFRKTENISRYPKFAIFGG